MHRALALLLMLYACGAESTPIEPGGPSGPSDDPRWIPIPAAPVSPAAQRHDDLFFLDASRGWLVNTRGEVWRTADAGGSWTRTHTDTNTFYRAIGFADEQTGWIGNLNFFNNPRPNSALFETRDGGTTWTNISDRIAGVRPVGICGLFVIDASTIVGVGRWNGPAVFVRSRDGGTSWQGIELAPLATGLVDVHFFDRDNGIAVGGLGVGNAATQQQSSRTVILATHDGGETWQTRYTSSQQGKWAWKISFPTRQVGYVSTQGPTMDGIVLKTVDGGATWSEIVAAPGHGFSGIGFLSDRVGWVAADTIAFTTADGGATWSPSDIGVNINRFRFLSGTMGYAAGMGVYRYVAIPD